MNHVAIDRLDESNSGVVPARDDVDEVVVDADLDLHLWVPLDEPRQEARNDERYGGAWDRDSDAARDLTWRRGDHLQGFQRLIDRRTGVLE